MRAGEQDRSVIIQSASTASGSGASDPDWDSPTTVATVYAKKIFRRGSEGLDVSQIRSTANVVWRIGYRTGITTSMRLVDSSDEFDIEVVDDSRKRDGELYLHCIQRDA